MSEATHRCEIDMPRARPPWACTRWGSHEHDWLDCPECKQAYERDMEMQPRRSEQEWTPETVRVMIIGAIIGAASSGQEWQYIADAFNAALSAERERVLLEVSQDRTATGHATKVEQIAIELKRQLAAEQKRRQKAEQRARDADDHALRQINARDKQLLSAQAAIENARNTVYAERRDEILNSVDLSALNEHDDEVRKPLVDLLGECRTKLDWSVTDGEFLQRIDDALVKVET